MSQMILYLGPLYSVLIVTSSLFICFLFILFLSLQIHFENLVPLHLDKVSSGVRIG
jgi:hypothetical protein